MSRPPHLPLASLSAAGRASEPVLCACGVRGLEQWPEAMEACAEGHDWTRRKAQMERRQEQLHRRLDPACWQLSRFSEVVESHTQGQTLESKPFHAQGYKWRFTLNPCGKSSTLTVSRFTYAGGGSVTATYTLAVELTSGERLGTHTCSKRFERDTTWGSNVVDRDVALERSAADDTLVVRLCELHIIDTSDSIFCAALNLNPSPQEVGFLRVTLTVCVPRRRGGRAGAFSACALG